MQLAYSISWQTPGRVLISAVGMGRGKRLLLGSKRSGIRGVMLSTAWVSVRPLGCTGPYPGAGKGRKAVGAGCHLPTPS